MPADADRRPFRYVLSLGSRCVCSRILRDLGLRKYAGPFDWIYSNAEMVRHALRTDFVPFLDTTQIHKAGQSFSHATYGELLARKVVFPHHDPVNRDREHFRRAVGRFRAIARSRERKLFIMAYLVKSAREVERVRASEAGGAARAEIKQLFLDLRRKGVVNFEFLAVHVMESASSGKARAQHVYDSRQGRERLLIKELLCQGACTGLYFKNQNDEKAMRRLFEKRSAVTRCFDLRHDPLPTSVNRVNRPKMGDVASAAEPCSSRSTAAANGGDDPTRPDRRVSSRKRKRTRC